ncbi:MAG: hypothetical protein ACYC1E_03405 [Propionibacteriaceae bacterium]
MVFQDLRRSIQGADHGLTRAACMVALAAATVMACSSCAAPTTSGSLGTLAALAQGCPSGRSVATLVELDGTGSSQADDILSSRMAIVRDQATKVAVCAGLLRVAVFTSGVSATKVIFDAPLAPQGATQIAQLRRVPELVDAAMKQIEAAYPQAVVSLPQTGTDVTAVFRSGAEYNAQVSAGKSPVPQVSLVVLTDGVQNLGLPLDQTTLTDEQAARLAAGTPTVSLDGVGVTFAGIGRVDGTEPPTGYVEALKVFYRKTCEASQASSCTVVTDYALGQ